MPKPLSFDLVYVRGREGVHVLFVTLQIKENLDLNGAFSK